MNKTEIVNVLENTTNDLSKILKHHLKEISSNVKDLIDNSQQQLLELLITLREQ